MSAGIGYKLMRAIAGDTFREIEQAAQKFNAVEAKMREAFGVTIDVDEDQWRKLTDSPNRDLPSLTHYQMQRMALFLWQSNLLANRIVELPLAYMLAEGVRLVADDETGTVQGWIDRFWGDPINKMDLKLPKKCRELSLFGEQCYPTFVNEANGNVRLGYLDPCLIETIVTDPDNGEQPIGLVTKRDRKGSQRRYRLIVNGPEQDLFTRRTARIRETFDTGEAFYFSVNDLSNGTRGRSDLLPQIDWLDAYDQYMFGELDRSKFMRSFIWDITLKGATPDEVKQRAKDITAPAPNSARVHNDSEEWKAEAPDLKAVDSAEAARLFRNHVLGGATIPEHWFGGGGDVNRAAAAEMGGPTYKMFVMRQTYIGYMLVEMGKYQIRQKELALNGKEPELFDPIYQIAAQFPEMIPRDTASYAAALQQVAVGCALAIDKGLLTDETAIKIVESISGRLGVEFDVSDELTNARAAVSRSREQDTFTNPPPDPNVDGASGVGAAP